MSGSILGVHLGMFTVVNSILWRSRESEGGGIISLVVLTTKNCNDNNNDKGKKHMYIVVE